jgi:hypothetical protein
MRPIERTGRFATSGAGTTTSAFGGTRKTLAGALNSVSGVRCGGSGWGDVAELSEVHGPKGGRSFIR